MSDLSKIINSYGTRGPTSDSSSRIAMIKQVQRRISQYIDNESKTATLFGHKVGSGSQGAGTNSGDSSQRTYFNMTFSGLSVKQK
tara:strand:+ start:517 stop:771 length:255 start_codon:yes stop_codon:yes gene_type:complete